MKEKLIRDKYAQQIDPTRLRTAGDEEYLILLFQKLEEEVQEVLMAPDLNNLAEELADVLTVMKAIAERHNIVEEMFNKVTSKSLEKGEFSKKLVLKLE